MHKMQSIFLPSQFSLSEELWQQCLSGDCTDLVLCCDDGFVKTHKAILVSCLPWLKDSDTDTVIMPGIAVEKLKEAIKEYYLTNESKATLWYFCALFEYDLQGQCCPTVCDVVEVDQDIKKGVGQNVNSVPDQDMNSLVDETYLEKGFICKSENDEIILSDTQNTPLVELEQNFNFSYNGDEPATISARKHKNLQDKEPNSFPCNICGKMLSTKGVLKEHIKSVHDRIYDKVCPHCDYRASTNKNLTTHIHSSHKGSPVKHIHKEERPFVCEECGIGFDRKSNLEKHLSSVHSTSSLPCHICGKPFKSELYLAAHMRNHDESSQVPCKFCNKKFVNKTILARHNLTAHSDDRPFVCEECGMGFKRKNILKNHISSIHSTSSFPCGECGKLFKSEAYVASHMRAHVESSQYPCHFCTRKFVTRTKLKMHINTHTGETPYKCPHNCGKSFHSSDQLSHHKKQCQDQLKLGSNF